MELFWRLQPNLNTIHSMSDHKLSNQSFKVGNLVVYKQTAAYIVETSSKRITINLSSGEEIRVRPKDIMLLHPGPIDSLSKIEEQIIDSSDLLAAWELLAGNETNLRDLVELAYGSFTPGGAWSVWKMVADGLYFDGDPDHISVHTSELVQQEKTRRAAREEEQRQWDEFVSRIAVGEIVDEDSHYLRDVEALAIGEQDQSQVLQALGREQTPENAHDLLLQIGYWMPSINPYPDRAGIKTVSAQGFIPPLGTESRVDLTHLQALAIDDEGNVDPDDAISWDNGRIWVHIADVAALVMAGDLLDLEARDRGANLYLPEKTVSMLPVEITQQLGLGLSERSAALSFGIDLNADGSIETVEIVPSWVKVTRWTYDEAEERLFEPMPANLLEVAGKYAKRRMERGAVELNLPEVRVKIQDGKVNITPFISLRSRELVREAMLMAGEAVAIYAQAHNIPIPYTTQEPPTAPLPEGNTMAEMFATRKLLKPGRQSIAPGLHSGLGMEKYAQVTSPLRRYLDLVIHQQLRAHFQGQTILTEKEITKRIGATAAIQRDLRNTERSSRRHWTYVYLMQNPDWQGQGIIVEQHGRRFTIILPDLDLETDLYLPGDHQLNETILLKLQEVNLAYLTSRFTPITSLRNP
jgi:exoribonuclease-2